MMHRTKLLEFLRSLKNIFNITWIKKNGDIRSANVRLRVRKNLKGGKSVAKPNNSYITIWLMGKSSGYRILNLDTVMQVRANNKIYNIQPEPITEHIDLTTTSNQPDNVIAIKA